MAVPGRRQYKIWSGRNYQEGLILTSGPRRRRQHLRTCIDDAVVFGQIRAQKCLPSEREKDIPFIPQRLHDLKKYFNDVESTHLHEASDI